MRKSRKEGERVNEIETVEPEVLDDTSKIDTYTRNDYLKSTLPYDYIWGFHSDRFKFAQIKEAGRNSVRKRSGLAGLIQSLKNI